MTRFFRSSSGRDSTQSSAGAAGERRGGNEPRWSLLTAGARPLTQVVILCAGLEPDPRDAKLRGRVERSAACLSLHAQLTRTSRRLVLTMGRLTLGGVMTDKLVSFASAKSKTDATVPISVRGEEC